MVYSGNLNALRDAIDHLAMMGFKVEQGHFKDPERKPHTASVKVLSETNCLVYRGVFSHYDEDCLVNGITAWLKGRAEELKGTI